MKKSMSRLGRHRLGLLELFLLVALITALVGTLDRTVIHPPKYVIKRTQGGAFAY